MAANVFGNPITNESLKGLFTPLDRSTIALETKNADGKDVNARKFLEDLEERFFKDNASVDEHQLVTAKVLLYNATGNPMTLVSHHRWFGKLGESPYPIVIGNGQWGAFMHVLQGDTDLKSEGGVIYQGKNVDGDDRYWIVCWQSSFLGRGNLVYTDVRVPNTFSDIWDSIDSSILQGPDGEINGWGYLFRVAKNEGGWLFGSIGDTINPECEAIMTLPGAIN